jgi:cytochrome P450
VAGELVELPQDHVFLGLEVAEEGAAPDARGLGDVFDGRLVEALVQEQLAGLVADGVPYGLLLTLAECRRAYGQLLRLHTATLTRVAFSPPALGTECHSFPRVIRVALGATPGARLATVKQAAGLRDRMETAMTTAMTATLRTPPGPSGLPWLGALPRLFKDPLAFYTSMTLDHGPLAFAQLGPRTMYMVNDPDLIDELLTGHAKHCIKDALTRTLHPMVGQGLLTSKGELWRRQRKFAAQPFAPKRISSYADVMVRAAQRAFERYADGEQRDFHVDIMALTLTVVSETLLGVSTEAESTRIAHLLEDMLAHYEQRLATWMRLLPPALPTAKQRRFKRAKAELDGIVSKIIEQNRNSEAGADHLLARLIRARTDDGEAMSAQQLLDEAVTMMLAGHETTALTLMYTVYLLSRNPAVAARLQREVDALGGRAPTAADVASMPYLDAVLRESLRLYPPAYAFGREVIEPFTLGGYDIPVGAQMVVCTFGMHRQPRFFPEPERFSPERWLPGGSAHALPRYAYLPFGGGHRICIGSHFAQLEAGLLLTCLLQQVELHVVPGYRLELRPAITVRAAHGLPVRVRRRAPAPRDTGAGPSGNDEALRASAIAAGCPHAAARASTD